ncbi:MAG TPA: hypothetical protein VGG30_07240, partial [Pirellulales bacterium]
RRLGTFSHLTFTAPADGDYLVRVSDVRGFGGPTMGYQLIVRRPQPDFVVSVSGKGLKVPVGSAKPLFVNVDRKDGFTGPVKVEIAEVPPGFYVTSPIIIEAGQRAARGVLAAHPGAQPPTPEAVRRVRIRASAVVGGAEVTKPVAGLEEFTTAPKPKLLVRIAPPGQSPGQPTGDAATSLDFPQPAELTIAPGSTITLTMTIERNGFDGIVTFEANNLPFGVIVDNIGLNGIQLLEGHTERTLFLSAARITAEQDCLFTLNATAEEGQSSLPILLHVRSAPAVAGK